VGVLVAVVAVGLGVLNAAAALAHRTERTHRAFPDTVRYVDVSSSEGSIRVIGGGGSGTSVDALVDLGLARPSHREELEGDRLVIHSGDCGALAGPFCSVGYTIHVPQGIQVTVTSGGGTSRSRASTETWIPLPQGVSSSSEAPRRGRPGFT
jgi:hypothetical protein